MSDVKAARRPKSCEVSERKKRLTKAQLIAWARRKDACDEGLAYLRRTPGTAEDAWNKCRYGDHMWWLMYEAETCSPGPMSDDWKAWQSAPRRLIRGNRFFSSATIRKHYRWETLEGLILEDINRSAKR